jgi:putative ABC transport system permease protein
VADLEGAQPAVSSVLLDVQPAFVPALEQQLRKSPHVIDVSDLRADSQRLRDMNADVMDVWTFVSITLAASVILGVVYNNARIALAARGRDLASLRVLGFSRAEISRVLLGGLAIEVLLAVPLGLWLGRRWGEWFMGSVDQEMFRWAVTVAPTTYAMATAVTLLAATASALWVRRNLDHLDLIAVLKNRE